MAELVREKARWEDTAIKRHHRENIAGKLTNMVLLVAASSVPPTRQQQTVFFLRCGCGGCDGAEKMMPAHNGADVSWTILHECSRSHYFTPTLTLTYQPNPGRCLSYGDYCLLFQCARTFRSCCALIYFHERAPFFDPRSFTRVLAVCKSEGVGGAE